MSDLVVIPARSTRTIVEQYLGEHLTDLEAAGGDAAVLRVANGEGDVAPVAADAAPAPTAFPDDSVTAPATDTGVDAAPVNGEPGIRPEPARQAPPVGAIVEAEALLGSTPESGPCRMLTFRIGPLRFALPNASVAAAGAAASVIVDVVGLVPAAYAAIAAAGRGGDSIALACGVTLTGLHREDVTIVTQPEIRVRLTRGCEPWIVGTTLKPARFVLDVDALAQAFGSR